MKYQNPSKTGPVQRLMLAAVASIMIGGVSVLAQVSQVEPYWAYVTEGDSLLRSGFRDAVEYYPVAKLAQGTLVRVDGESKEWMQVTYPPGTPAFVAFDAGTVDLTSKTFTLTKQSRLSAANINDGLKGSWRPLLATPLESGTRLVLADTTPVESNRGKAWKVIAPDAARGYLPTKSVRKASESEVSAYLKANPAMMRPEPAPIESARTEPKTSESTKTDVSAPKPMDLRDPTVGTPVPESTGTPGDGSKGADGAGHAPDAATPAANGTDSKPSSTIKTEPRTTQPRPEPKPPAPGPMDKYVGLESAFRAVQQQPVMDGEFAELIAEYEKAINEAPSDQPRLKAGLSQRLELLKIRADLQEQRRQLVADQQAVQGDKAIVEQKVADFDRARQYVVVGRLSASTIYDGVRLPLMYRVQTVGGTTSGRTLGYVKAQDGVNPERFIGAIVGIVGESQIDPTLKLNIVTPKRIDSLESLPGASAEVGPGTAAAPANTPSAGAEQPSQAEAPTDWVSPSDPR